MPRVTILQSNFTAGELSPRLYGRVDVARYANGAKRIRNGRVLLQGGVIRDWGTRYLGQTANMAVVGRLVPFVFNRTQVFMLEFGNFTLRFWNPDGTRVETSPGVAYQLTTPYDSAAIGAVDFTQSADTLIIWSESVTPHRLVRYGTQNWVIEPVPFIEVPADEIGERINQVGTLSAATVGSGRTLTVLSALFLSADVGRTISSGSGLATITAVASGTSATVNITRAFASTTLAANAWAIDASPQSTITPSATGPVGSQITLTSGATILEGAKTITGLSWGGNLVTVTITGHGYATNDQVVISGVDVAAYNGTRTITVIDANTFRFSLSPDPGPASSLGTAQRAVPGTGTWRTTHVGGYVRMNNGLMRIVSVSTVTAAIAQVLTVLNATTAAPADAWSLEFPVWNAVDGYPRTGTLWEQRLIAAGSPRFPQTVWGSRTGEPFNFARGVIDDDGFAFVLQSDEVNPIAYMVSGRTLVALTLGAEFTLQGGIEKPITPTNVQIRGRSNHGCALVRPVRVGREELFVQRAGRKVRAFSYNVSNDDYTAPDITVLAEHITGSAVIELAYQRSPEPWLYALREDGKLAVCTYELQDENVVAWALRDNPTGDSIESIAVIPDDTNGEALWAIVRRTLNGSPVRYVERFTAYAVLDCEVVGTSGTAQTTWGGLSHLNGRQVDVQADGYYAGRYTVTGGQIVLARAARVVNIGLPFTTRIEMLTPELQMGEGSAQGNSMRIGETTLRFLGTVGGKINDQQIPTRTLDTNTLDAPPDTTTGLERLETLGWGRGEAELVIEQDLPLPFHLLSVVRKVTVNT